MLLVIDHDQKTVQPLHLNRDTICEVPWLDENGEIGGYHTEHLAYAHTYGSGKEDSCENTVQTVRKLLFHAPINQYLGFTMDVVPIINDVVGGVTVKLKEDLPELGEEYKKDAEITLYGDAALRFIRFREHLGGTNWLRMKRQRQYLYAFADAARIAQEQNPDLAIDAFKRVNPYLVTNMSVNNVSALIEQLCSYQLLDALVPSGDILPGEEIYEFHVHEESLWNCVFSAYCHVKSGDEEPA